MDRETGQTMRYPSSALLCVNSEDSEQFNKAGFRLDTGTPADIYINKQNPLLAGYLTRIALTEMNVQWGFPNVYSDAPVSGNSNNTLTIQIYDISGVSQGTTRITLASGFYAAGNLGSAVQTQLNANALATSVLGANTFTVLVGGLQCKAASSVSQAGQTVSAGSSSFTIITSSTTGFFQIMPFQTPVAGQPSIVDDLTNMMGLTPSLLTGLQYYREFTGGYASCMRTPYIDVISKSLTINQRVKDNETSRRGQASILARLYLANEEAVPRDITITYATASPYNAIGFTDNAFGTRETTFRREFKFPKMLQWSNTENVDVVDLQVVDHRGNVLQYTPTIVGITPDDGGFVQQSNTSDIQFTLMGMEQ